MRLSVLEYRIPPPVVGLLVAIAMWLASGLEPALPVPDLARKVSALVLACAGGGFDLLGFLAFRRLRTTINPLKPDKASTLATDGVYRVTRNPMYLGMAFILAGWAVYLGGAWALLGPAAFAAYITRFQILPEERILQAKFGDAFAAYRARVRRWL